MNSKLAIRHALLLRALCFVLLALTAAAANSEPKRPKIFGIAYVQILSSDPVAAKGFYENLGVLRSNYQTPGLSPERGGQDICPDCGIIERIERRREQVSLVKDRASAPDNRIEKVVFRVSDTKKLQRYLSARGVHIRSSAPALGYLEVADPGGQTIGFLSSAGGAAKEMTPALLPIIHAGFLVRDRAVTEHFYKDILGFRPYWHGGMKDDRTDWEALQVPDGTDWVELMLNVPENADQRLRGIMNHIALGVTDIHEMAKQLQRNGMHLTEEPKIGRDGKWQLNVYDPDQTRIEFMEFTPKDKPCCSEFTGPHPKP